MGTKLAHVSHAGHAKPPTKACKECGGTGLVDIPGQPPAEDLAGMITSMRGCQKCDRGKWAADLLAAEIADRNV